jgi:hypothetical protein
VGTARSGSAVDAAVLSCASLMRGMANRFLAGGDDDMNQAFGCAREIGSIIVIRILNCLA